MKSIFKLWQGLQHHDKIMAILVLLNTLVGIFFIYASFTWIDEGLYFNWAQLIVHGKLPYRDFFFYQPPLYLYLLALTQIFGPSFVAGRILSLLFYLGSTILIYLICRKKINSTVGIAAVILFSANFFARSYYTAMVLFAPVIFFSLLTLYFALSDPKRRNLILVGIFAALTASIRLSLVPGLVILFVYVVIKNWRQKMNIVWVIISFLSVLAIVWLPFLFTAPKQTIEGSFGYLYDKYWPADYGINKPLLNPSYYLSLFKKISIDFFAIIILSATTIVYEFFAFLISLKKKKIKIFLAKGELTILLMLIVLALAVTHIFLTNYPSSTYTIYYLAFLAILAGWTIGEIYLNIKVSSVRILGLILILLFVLNFFKDNFKLSDYPLLKNPQKSDWLQIKKTTGIIMKNSDKHDLLLTFLPHYSGLSQRYLPLGFEYSWYGYSPQFNDEQIRQFRLFNQKILLNLLKQKKVKLVLLSDFDRKRMDTRFSNEKEGVAACDKMMILVNKNYHLINQEFSQTWNGNLYLYGLN